MKRKQAGFSLIELLIVVAIILIIAAIALPNLMVARMSANEASAVQSLRTIQSAETAYATTFPAVGFSATLVDLSGGTGAGCTATPTQACLIDAILASGNKSGYVITWTGDGLTNALCQLYRQCRSERPRFEWPPKFLHKLSRCHSLQRRSPGDCKRPHDLSFSPSDCPGS